MSESHPREVKDIRSIPPRTPLANGIKSLLRCIQAQEGFPLKPIDNAIEDLQLSDRPLDTERFEQIQDLEDKAAQNIARQRKYLNLFAMYLRKLEKYKKTPRWIDLLPKLKKKHQRLWAHYTRHQTMLSHLREALALYEDEEAEESSQTIPHTPSSLSEVPIEVTDKLDAEEEVMTPAARVSSSALFMSAVEAVPDQVSDLTADVSLPTVEKEVISAASVSTVSHSSAGVLQSMDPSLAENLAAAHDLSATIPDVEENADTPTTSEPLDILSSTEGLVILSEAMRDQLAEATLSGELDWFSKYMAEPDKWDLIEIETALSTKMDGIEEHPEEMHPAKKAAQIRIIWQKVLVLWHAFWHWCWIKLGWKEADKSTAMATQKKITQQTTTPTQSVLPITPLFVIADEEDMDADVVDEEEPKSTEAFSISQIAARELDAVFHPPVSQDVVKKENNLDEYRNDKEIADGGSIDAASASVEAVVV